MGKLTEATAMDETMMLGLRLVEGLMNAVRQRHGLTIDAVYGTVLAEYVAHGLVTRDGGRLALTARGRLLTDAIAARLLGD